MKRRDKRKGRGRDREERIKRSDPRKRNRARDWPKIHRDKVIEERVAELEKLGAEQKERLREEKLRKKCCMTEKFNWNNQLIQSTVIIHQFDYS